MSKVPGIPGLSLPPQQRETPRVQAVQEAARRAVDDASPADFGSAVRVSYGRFRLAVPLVLVAALFGGLGWGVQGLTKPQSSTQSADYAQLYSKLKDIETAQQRDAATNAQVIIRLEDRLATLETKISVLESQQTAILLAVRQH